MNVAAKSRIEAGANVPDDEFIRRALNEAQINVLRVALYHQTKNPRLSAMKVDQAPIRGGVYRAYVVDRDYHDEIRDLAFEYLKSSATPKPVPTIEETEELIGLYLGRKATSVEVGFGYEELAFAGIPRDAQWSKKPAQKEMDAFHVTIVGAGFSGVAAAIQLDRLRIKYRIIERYEDVGGTWQINNYPEARVDVPSILYQYSFEHHYPWKSYYATRDELKEYLHYIVDKYDVGKNIEFNTLVKSAIWSDEDKKWTVTLESTDGSETEFETNFIFSCAGLFSTPQLPGLPGIDRYKGRIFHTTQWDHSYDYTGKRVALIGTGSTGTQLARTVAGKASHFTVFQRTANWVTPVQGYHAHVSLEYQWLQDNMPGYFNWKVFHHSFGEFQMQEFQELDPDWIAEGGRVNEKNARLKDTLTKFIEFKVGDRKDILEKVMPDHPPLARRLVIDNEWYDTLCRDNVDLVKAGVTELTPTGLIDSDGNEHEFDLIVFAAGFKVSEYLWPTYYQGRGGANLKELWAKDGARAYMGYALPGFPNLFMVYGPNAQTRVGSAHSVFEMNSRYICNLITRVIESGDQAVEVKREAYDAYNAEMDDHMETVLWKAEKGGGGYYLNKYGRPGVSMPWTLLEYYERTREPDYDQYTFY